MESGQNLGIDYKAFFGKEEARKYNLRTRDVEKAYFMKNCERSSCR